MPKEKILIIVGPTAVGKTALSIELAEEFSGEIISGDSMQVYKHLDIGTAKVTVDEMQGIPHHLIDILDINDEYSASDFQKQAQLLIQEISQRGKLPVVAGGTGLYIESLIYDVSHGGSSPKNDRFRQEMEDFASDHGKTALWEKLKEQDLQAAEKIHPNNQHRVIRALEVIHETGRKFSDFQSEREEKDLAYDSFIIALDTDRQVLYERINRRVDQMMEQGLLEEARKLYEESKPDAQARRGIGYKEFFPYFEGRESLDQAVGQLKQNSRRYAKRQLTWFRNRTPVDLWVDVAQEPCPIKEIKNKIETFLKR